MDATNKAVAVLSGPIQIFNMMIGQIKTALAPLKPPARVTAAIDEFQAAVTEWKDSSAAATEEKTNGSR